MGNGRRSGKAVRRFLAARLAREAVKAQPNLTENTQQNITKYLVTYNIEYSIAEPEIVSQDRLKTIPLNFIKTADLVSTDIAEILRVRKIEIISPLITEIPLTPGA